MKVVIDTKVLVSAFLSPYGKPADILRLLLTEKLQLCYDTCIISEYREVLHRPRFGFNLQRIDIILNFLQSSGGLVTASRVTASLPDPDDRLFWEVALSGKADCLITGNRKHIPASQCRAISIMTPAQFLSDFVTTNFESEN